MEFRDSIKNRVNIMFWNANLGLNPNIDKEKIENINTAIISLVKEFNVAILVLAEYPIDIDALADRISFLGREFNVAYFVDNHRLKMLYDHRFKYELIRDNGYSFVSSIEDQLTELNFLLTGVHLPSRLHKKEEDITLETRKVMDLIRVAEKQECTEKCIVLGDFNLSPYDKGLVNCDSFHAIPFAEIVKEKKSRQVNGEKYQLFYNPMWNFFGDFGGEDYTYYYDSGGIDNTYKYIFDQVLFSAQMIEPFIPESLSIVSSLPEVPLATTKGKPNKKIYSDHFPIVFSLGGKV